MNKNIENNKSIHKKDNKPIKTIAKLFLVLSFLGQGMTGLVYKARDLLCSDLYAIKISAKISPNKEVYKSLKNEAKILEKLNGIPGFPKLKIFFKDDFAGYLVMSYLGNNLSDIHNICNKKLSLLTISYIGFQLIERIQTFHNLGFIHRDIKPANICVDEIEKKICLIDFSLSKSYLDQDNMHIEHKNIKSFTGTLTFSSSNAMMGFESSRKDDLISIGYTLIYLFYGSLPWQNYYGSMQIKRDKSIHIKQIIPNLPEVFDDYFTYVFNLDFDQKPNYQFLLGLFFNVFVENKWNMSWKNLDFNCLDKNNKGIDLDARKIMNENLDFYKKNLMDQSTELEI